MRLQNLSLGEHGPYLLMGVLCWLCGAVVVGIGVQVFFGWIPAALAAAVLSIVFLCVFWALGSAASAGGEK